MLDTNEKDGSGAVLHLALDPADLRLHPAEKIDAIADALSKGQRVELSPVAPGAPPLTPSPAALQLLLDVITVYLGVAFPVLVSVAIAPASVTAALVAGVAGGAVTVIGIWLCRKRARKS